ncbi:unnamed protein product [Caenorhabditis auriculariae]|uniref:INTS8 TPR repeats domain-containing protein n=1 Tax=Caenorhabditis auriculariae TaxID=2777116 RepID=A0A8S1GNJ0_9PELO|nr:unnamed protein product [Caenorhabditis auriculariae]
MDELDTSGSSWFDCFINLKTFSANLKNKKNIPKLCVQFTERAIVAERDRDAQISKNMPPEDVAYCERKAASLWLCGLACFATIDWDFEYIIENVSRFELLIIRALIDQTYKMYAMNERKLDPVFGNWLFYRWCLSLDRRFKVPQPPPKATIAHQSHINPQSDPAFQRSEKVQRMLSEFREHLQKARFFLGELMEQKREVAVPGPRCFTEPLLKAFASLDSAVQGDRDVLAVPPCPDFNIDSKILKGTEVANKCCAELVTFFFTNGDFSEVKRHLVQMVPSTSSSFLVAVDDAAMHGYATAVCATSCYAFNSKYSRIERISYSNDLPSKDNDYSRKSELFRNRADVEVPPSLANNYQAENLARTIIDGKMECVRDRLRPDVMLHFLKAVRRQTPLVRSHKQKVALNGYLQFLCATTLDLKESLTRFGFDTKIFRGLAVASPKTKQTPLPTTEMIKALMACDDPWWNILTKFSLSSLKEALRDLGPYWHPQTMLYSEFLKAIVSREEITANINLQRLLLGKLEQLAQIHNYKEFAERLSEYSPEILGINSKRLVELVYEGMQVQARIGNDQSFVSYDRLQDIRAPLFAAIFNQDFHPPEKGSTEMINQCLAIMLNLGEFKLVFEKAGQINLPFLPMVPIARLLGAYGVNLADNVTVRKCVSAFSQHVTPFFTREAKHSTAAWSDVVVSQMVHLFDLIRHTELVSFLLAFLVQLHNRAMSKRSSLRIFAEKSSLFGSDTAPLDNAKIVEIKQCLRVLCKKALETSKTNPSYLRTVGDFHYVEGNYQMAMLRYLEYFSASSCNQRQKLVEPDFFHESMLQRMRLCLSQAGQLTLAACICQPLKLLKPEELRRSAKLLRANETRDDGANCSLFVFDSAAVEVLSDHYFNTKQSRSLDVLYAGGSSLPTNRNARQDLWTADVAQRTSRLLRALSAAAFNVHL